MLLLYKKSDPSVLHLWYNHDMILNYHGSYVSESQSANLSNKSKLWSSMKVVDLNHSLVANAIYIYIHGKFKSVVDLNGFNSLRTVEFMEHYPFSLINIRQSTITIITSRIPANLNVRESVTIKNKLISSEGRLKHFINIRSVYLNQPDVVGKDILNRSRA